MTAADVKEVRANPPLTVPGHSNLNEGLRQDVQFFLHRSCTLCNPHLPAESILRKQLQSHKIAQNLFVFIENIQRSA